MRKPPVKVDVPVEDVDSDIAQGEDYPGLRNFGFWSHHDPKFTMALQACSVKCLVLDLQEWDHPDLTGQQFF